MREKLATHVKEIERRNQR